MNAKRFGKILKKLHNNHSIKHKIKMLVTLMSFYLYPKKKVKQMFIYQVLIEAPFIQNHLNQNMKVSQRFLKKVKYALFPSYHL